MSYNSKVYAEKGEGIIHQMISYERGKGHATKVFEEFFEMIDTNLYLSVRTSNHKAIGFYNKMGMRQVGKTSWGNNTMKGLIYYKESIR